MKKINIDSRYSPLYEKKLAEKVTDEGTKALKETVKLLKEKVEFRDISVNVYQDLEPTSEFQCCWQMRNPDSCYTGIMFMNWETGKLTYPEGAVIPEQTDRDREMLPKFIVTEKSKLEKEDIKLIKKYLDKEYTRRNNH